MKKLNLIFFISFFNLIFVYNQQIRFVTNTADTGTGSLRYAIDNAENGDTISFDSSLQGDTIFLESSIEIDSVSLLVNLDKKNITISGQHKDRIFKIRIANGDSIFINNLNIIDGYCINDDEINSGGGMFICLDSGSFLSMNDCSFIADTIKQGNGGAIYITSNDTDSTGGGVVCMTGCKFEKNYTNQTSGAVDNQSFVKIFFDGCSFISNYAYRGGVGFLYYAVFKNCYINKNYSGSYCATLLLYYSEMLNTGIYNNLGENMILKSSYCKFNNVIVAGNISKTMGIINLDEYTSINNCTFTDNYYDYQYLIQCWVEDVSISNCIFYNNHSEDGFLMPTLSSYGDDYYYCVFTGIWGDVAGKSIITVNPFNDINFGMGADSLWGTDDDNLALNDLNGGGLLCINRGNKNYLDSEITTDFAGNPRIFDGKLDVGAVEYMEHLPVKHVSNNEIDGINGNKIVVYPNPVINSLTIQLSDVSFGEEVNIRIYSSMGQELYYSDNIYEGSSLTIEPALTSGTYILKIASSRREYTCKLIK